MSITGIQAALGFLGTQRREPHAGTSDPAVADFDQILALARTAGYQFQIADLEEAFRIQMRARLLSATGSKR